MPAADLFLVDELSMCINSMLSNNAMSLCTYYIKPNDRDDDSDERLYGRKESSYLLCYEMLFRVISFDGDDDEFPGFWQICSILPVYC